MSHGEKRYTDSTIVFKYAQLLKWLNFLDKSTSPCGEHAAGV
jgi:hypothetical protein